MYYVNGVLANGAFDVTPSSGRISLQVEVAEMDFRNFELHPLGKSAGKKKPEGPEAGVGKRWKFSRVVPCHDFCEDVAEGSIP